MRAHKAGGAQTPFLWWEWLRADEGYAAPELNTSVSQVNFPRRAIGYSRTAEWTGAMVWRTEREDVCVMPHQITQHTSRPWASILNPGLMPKMDVLGLVGTLTASAMLFHL